MPAARALLLALLALLVAGYLGINLVAPLPAFLVGENLVYAASYSALGFLVARGSRRAHPVLALLAGFNAGRVSRTLLSPSGELGGLALEHVPLLAVVSLVALLALYLSLKRG